MTQQCSHTMYNVKLSDGKPELICALCFQTLRLITEKEYQQLKRDTAANKVLANPIEIKIQAPYIPVIPKTFTLRIQDQLITDDGIGGLHIPPVFVECGTINYETGEGVVHLQEITCTYQYGVTLAERKECKSQE